MGMAAGQARLLSITARLTDNENNGQALSYSKQRLADETEQVNAAYIQALAATKLTVLTGFNGSSPNYTDISYGLMTGYDTVACGKQYVVTNTKGQILVTKKQADAFEKGNGDINTFLAEFGYSQCDLDTTDATASNTKIHEAWDKYLKSVGLSFYTEEHDEENPAVEFGYTSFKDQNGTYSPFNGYATYTYNGETKALNYEGTTKEQRELYDYAMSLTEGYYGQANSAGTLKTPVKDAENTNYINYLRNIFNQMSQFGYYTEKDESSTINQTKVYKGGTGSTSWFEQQLKEGKLLLKYYSATEKDFVQTTLSDDDAIQEVEDERQIAIVEAKYTQDTAALEKKDKKIDLELKKLDTEHNALQTEYDSVKSVIDKNVEKSFNMFS